MRKFINTLIIMSFVALVAWVTFLAWSKSNGGGAKPKPAPEAAKPAETPAPQLARVRVQPLQQQTMREYLLLPGTLEAWEDIDLSVKAGGTIERLGPKEGDRLTSGDLILQLDTASRRALVNQVQATLAQAEKQYERINSLVASRVVTRAELDNAVAARDVARANLEVARVGLEDATLRSPINGILDRLTVDAGEHVNPGQVVAKIVETDRLKVLLNVPEKDVSYCKQGADAAVFAGELRLEQAIAGRIRYVAMTADALNRTYPMRVEISNREGKLRPGMIVRAGLIRQQVDQALAVPLYALVDRGDRKVVYLEKDGRAVQREVTTGIIDGDQIQVVRGLNAGDRLIVVGHRDLADGVPVEVEGTVQP